MANLTPAAGYDNVPQLETNTSVLAGPGGPSNSQAQALLNRTEQLKNEVSGKATLTNTAPVAEPVGATQSLGSSGEAARSDHRHEMPGLATDAAPGFIELATQTEVNTGTDGQRAVTPATLAARLATEALAGLIELATQGETDAGTDDARAITAAKLVAYLRNAAGSAASDTQRGTVELATAAEVQTGSDNVRAVTPAGHASDATTTNTANRLVRRDASGNINVGTVNGALNGNAASATLATKASTLSQGGGNGAAMTFNWAGQGGQPNWLWGGNDGANHYVYNPSNFNVNYANSAGNGVVASSFAGTGYAKIGGLIIQWGSGAHPATFTFPLAFPNLCASVLLTNRGNPGDQITDSVNTMSTTSFTTVGWAHSVSWLAIGY